MQKINRLISRGIHLFKSDSLFRNSVFLIASTAIMSVLGFGFWLAVAHLYTPEQIGSASALIAVTTLLGNISLLGMEASLIRFLPSSKAPSRDINTTLAVVVGASILAAIGYLLIAPLLGIDIMLLHQLWQKVGFVVLMVVVGLNSLTDAVFIANRRAELHTMTYSLLAAVKLVLPLLLIPFGSMGIFLAYAAAMLSSLMLTFFLMKRSVAYRFSDGFNWGLLRSSRKYAANNYVGHILSSLSSQIMPLLILTRLGADAVAYFAMAWTMAGFLYVIPTAIAQSLLAESAGSPAKRRSHLNNAVKLLVLILVPIVGVSIIAAPYILEIFGGEYSLHSAATFQILALATCFVAVNEVCNTILNIEHRSSGVVASQLSTLVVTVIATIFLIPFGLVGVGFALLLGMIASNLSHAVYFGLGIGKRNRPAQRELGAWLEDEAQYRAIIAPLIGVYGIHEFTVKSLAKGQSTRTFLVRYGQKARVLRIYSSQKPKEDIQREVEFMNYLAAKKVPVPRLFANDQGDFISECEINDEAHYYILMHFEQGAHPEAYSAQLIEQMAKSQAEIHLYGQVFSQDRPRRSQFTAKSDWLLRATPRGFSHCDYDASNILVHNQRMTCVLDFEGMRFVPLVSCLFFTLSRIYEDDKVYDNLWRYLAVYQKTRTLTWVEKFVIRTALAVHCRRPRLLFAAI